MGLEVNVIDDSDKVGWAAAATRVGELYMSDVHSMVTNVIAHVTQERQKMSRLNIIDHGSPRGFQIGTEHISSGTFPTHTNELVKLKPHFEPKGFVHLQHCQIGQNKRLLLRLAALLGVSVYAGLDYHNPVYRRNYDMTPVNLPFGWVVRLPNPFAGFEDYVRADPNGNFVQNANRP